jgi:DNA replication and repair protein RecF
VSAVPLLDPAVEPAAAPACRVDRLRMFRFRNYLDETVDLGAGLNVVCGQNAQGKTNLLEAVATLALSRSPRASTLGELVTWGESVGRVEAAIQRGAIPARLDMRITRRGDSSVRTTLVDGTERPARALLGLCPVVLFWPDDLQLVKGAPEGRRRLLDVVLSQLDPVAADDLLRYRRALEQRNALLRQVRQGAATAAALPQFTDELVRHGGAVRVHRARLTAQLSPLAAAALRELSGGDEELRLEYVTDGGAADDELPGVAEDGPSTYESLFDPAAAAAELAETLRERAAEELARGLTVAGPHRDDVAFHLDGRPARSSASQGQQRSAVLACKLAEVRHVAGVAGVTPVLLLDDVLSELDAGRRERLMAGLGAGRGVQALLTTTEATPPELSALGELRQFRVAGGRIREVEGE